MSKSCSFFGHRNIEITENLKNNLLKIIEDLIVSQNYEYFYFGGFGDFDSLCHEIVSKLKMKYSHIKRIFCLVDERHLKPNKRPKWLKSEDYEEFIYIDLCFDWWYKRIYFRNIEIVNKSDFIIFFVNNNTNSGAYKTMQYTIKQKKSFVNLG